jgi:primosomal protein N' (replication factor Y) (superfamily II helicase)
MEHDPKFTQVILPVPVKGTFTYQVPPDLAPMLKPGIRVVVPFGAKKLYTGIIHSLQNQPPEGFRVKPIISIVDETPIATQNQLDFWEWTSNYYLCPIGDVYKASVPSGFRPDSETMLIPLTNGKNELALSPDEQIVLSTLIRLESQTIESLAKITGINPVLPIIKTLIEKKSIAIYEEVRGTYKPKLRKVVCLSEKINSPDIFERTIGLLTPKQQLLLQWMVTRLGTEAFQGKTIPRKEIIDEALISATIIKGLVDKGMLTEFEEELSRLNNENTGTSDKKSLNIQQKGALEEIQNLFRSKPVVLLHGITGSGKTEIYIHLIEEVLKQNKQVLYLLPEIALTSQIVNRLRVVFGNKVGVYHSKYSDAERVEIWNGLLKDDENAFQIILGVRSSLFLPFTRLGLIIVDEEHENSYKQYDPSPRYNARDLSVVLALQFKANVLMGSATPSLESYFNAQTGRYGLVELNARHGAAQLPEILVVDTRKARKKKLMQSHFSQVLLSHIDEALAKNEQVILFQNRRGYSPYLECSQCGWIPKCKFCDVSLTYHKGTDKLVCHYCGYTLDGVYRCGHCKQPAMETKGFGTERIEDEIQLIFPDSRVGRLDMDTTRNKYGHEEIIRDFQDHKIDILIGTQMVSKGLDFDHVSLVGILNADNMLQFPDFRAHERSYQLMAQVSGRAGRKDKKGKVIIQTSDPENYIIHQVAENQYDKLFEQQLLERKTFFYPPYSRLISITLKHRDKQVVEEGSQDLALNLKTLSGLKVLGPSTPVINRIQNLYLKNILLKLSKNTDTIRLKNQVNEIISVFGDLAKFKSVIVSVNVDPM